MLKFFRKSIKSLWTFAFTKNESKMVEMTKDEYKALFITGRCPNDIEKTYNKAWESKNFEIELYWKRATYFWAFQVASFAGYFSVLGSNIYLKDPQVLYMVACIGLITGLSWAFINIGSKSWQRHWEAHVDMLEDEIGGPLYKTVAIQKTFSVSKINEIVSQFIVVTWSILIIKYFVEHISFCYTKWQNIDYQVWLSSLAVLYFIYQMIFGHGRGRFGERPVTFFKRSVVFKSTESKE